MHKYIVGYGFIGYWVGPKDTIQEYYNAAHKETQKYRVYWVLGECKKPNTQNPLLFL